MRKRVMAAAILLGGLCVLPQTRAESFLLDSAEPTTTAPSPTPALSLDQALRRVIEHHPDLRLYLSAAAERGAEAEAADQATPWRLQANAENLLGSGDASGVRSAELSIGLARVLERGGKRDARRALAAARLDALGAEQSAARLDLLAEVARRHLHLQSAQSMVEIQRAELEQRQRTVAAADRRVRAGAASRSVSLSAEAQASRAAIELDLAQRRIAPLGRRLALLWGEAGFEAAAAADSGAVAALRAEGDLFALPNLISLAQLKDLLETTPELEQFADRTRLAEARLRLAESEATPDLDLSLGLRRLQAGSDFGLVMGLSLPLGSRDRAAPGRRAAQAALDGLDVERASTRLRLHSTLLELHATYAEHRHAAAEYQSELLPRLQRAEQAAEQAYRAGALDALSWSQLQADTTAARLQQLQAAYAAQLALIELQRLTAEPMLAGAAAPEAQP